MFANQWEINLVSVWDVITNDGRYVKILAAQILQIPGHFGWY